MNKYEGIHKLDVNVSSNDYLLRDDFADSRCNAYDEMYGMSHGYYGAPEAEQIAYVQSVPCEDGGTVKEGNANFRLDGTSRRVRVKIDDRTYRGERAMCVPMRDADGENLFENNAAQAYSSPVQGARTERMRAEERTIRNGQRVSGCEKYAQPAVFASADEDIKPKRGRWKNFLLRFVAAALLLAFCFIPRIFPYKGSDKVTETVKTIVMTDITGNNAVGTGKLVDIVRDLIQKLTGNGGR